MVKHEAGPQFIKNVGCYGLESSLLNCSHSRDIQAECDAIEVHCIPGKKTTRIIKLTTTMIKGSIFVSILSNFLRSIIMNLYSLYCYNKINIAFMTSFFFFSKGYASTIMQIEMIGDITCSTYFVS